MALEKVRVTAAMNPPIFLVDYSHRLRLNGTAVVRVEAPSSMKSCGPIDLVALLDVSSIMSRTVVSEAETPSKLDLLKKAMKCIIGQLDDDDRLAMVAFNDQVIKEYTTGILEISGGGQMAIEKKVDGLMAKGDTTAFKPSLEHAVKLLDDRSDKKRVGFIILISDGVDNSQFKWSDESVTPTDPVRALLRKYPVHTLGLLKADPKALHYIAKESYGTYSSVTDNNLDKNMMEALAVCLAGFKTAVAFDTSVDITSSSLEILRISSGGYTRREPSGSILIGTLCAGEVKDLVVHFGYTTGSWERGYYTVLSGITAKVTYRDVPGGQPSASTDSCSVSLAVHTTQGSTPPANPCPPFPLALQQMVRFKVLDLLTSVLKELQALKQEAGSGRDEGDNPVLQAMAAKSLQRKWAEFKQSDQSWKDAPRALLGLGGIDRDVNAMVGVLKDGLGVGSIYSWMSSHQMQRPTVTSLPPDHDTVVATGGSRTPAMEAMVQEVHRQLLVEEAHAQVQEGKDQAIGKRAVELLDVIDKRFELWCKLDADVPPPFQPATAPQAGDESASRDLAAVLRGDISRARQHDVYLAAIHAIKQWRSFFTCEENTDA